MLQVSTKYSLNFMFLGASNTVMALDQTVVGKDRTKIKKERKCDRLCCSSDVVGGYDKRDLRRIRCLTSCNYGQCRDKLHREPAWPINPRDTPPVVSLAAHFAVRWSRASRRVLVITGQKPSAPVLPRVSHCSDPTATLLWGGWRPGLEARCFNVAWIV